MEKQIRPKAVLVGLHLPNVSEQEHKSSLAELGRLAYTLGFEVVATLSQKRHDTVAATIIGSGKLKELARLTGGTGIVSSPAPGSKQHEEVEDDHDPFDPLHEVPLEKADKVIFDDELTPTQLRNLETATGVEVLDRTGVIIEIFYRHAKTREARIQVEIARLKYLTPRLRLSRVGQDRQGGGIGAKGIGETAHELDKRRIRDRIAELSHELEDIHTNQVHLRQRRQEQLKVALVGYTNAGKSSLMRALTGSQVLVEDKLFATLDTVIRAIQPETTPRILISDTVGFIKKLPHGLVASFRSTLDEAADASLLLYVVDASDSTFREQLAVTREVLADLKLNSTNGLIVLNKADCLNSETIESLLREFPKSIAISTRSADDIAGLRDLIIKHFEKHMVEEDLFIPYHLGKFLGEVYSSMHVLHESGEDEGTRLRVRALPATIAAFKKHFE
ncbi:MAG: GTPase HflX [Oligoflexales bacterium]|nr:GTPase HflX [Oligoflexales bacterium]